MPESILSGCTSGGCGAKIGPEELSGLLQKLPVFSDANLLVGFGGSDDAAVYKISEDSSLIFTADFFSPMVDDARLFGQIAAANALSDVWAMGGRPILALNLVCFPEEMDKSVLAQILEGGAEKLLEAGAVLGGGHSIYDKEPKYGLAVAGLVSPQGIIRNNTPALGNRLILTKALGTGIIMAANRVGAADTATVQKATSTMQQLNKYAAEAMRPCAVSACTDITGFGLLAHALEMADTEATLELWPDALPLLPGAVEYAGEYMLTAAGQRNRNHVQKHCDVSALPFVQQELLFDPQTSGGLLIAVAKEEAEALLASIRLTDPDAAVIGQVLPRRKEAIVFA